MLHGRDRATRDLPGITSHYPRNPQQPGRHAGILERAWMAGVASNIGKFHVQQAKRLRAETAQKKKKKKKKIAMLLGLLSPNGK
ncbi:jg15908 [Pararge aegeria aegeria]|uniref:Jg15908 protein n=1 Tax=Pararge aegeria aegeria TaxID=348720 RepID=A0A8S4S506_9NEOP|nr:jg15908 [Pararge aegeria aegeria]